MIAVTVSKAGLAITKNLVIRAKELEDRALDGFGKKEMLGLKTVLREKISHCSGEKVADKSSKMDGSADSSR